ncbi:MAG: hypothetical protein AB7F96_02610 [Beijerinckiaceae bacterium]
MTDTHKNEKHDIDLRDQSQFDAMNATLRRMVKMPPKQHSDMKIGRTAKAEKPPDEPAKKSKRNEKPGQ